MIKKILKSALFCIVLVGIVGKSHVFATTWIELVTRMSGDDNVYSYVTPYHDAYSVVELGFNHKDKFRRSTHYALNLKFNASSYSQLTQKNNWNIKGGFNLEEDLSDTLVAVWNSNLNFMAYPDSLSSSYNATHFTTAPAIRFFMFDFDFTSIDWGIQYSMYNLPDYDFKDGWTPSLSFQEEVAEYNGFGTFLTLKQAMPWKMDLDFTGKIDYRSSGERPLYIDEPITGSDQARFTTDYRADTESSLAFGLMRKFQKGSYIKGSVCTASTNSNANALLYDVANSQWIFLPDYYNLNTLCVSLDSMYSFGQESSYLRLYLTYKNKNYTQRQAQDQSGTFLADRRYDEEISALLELNQRLGFLFGTGWTLKVGYQISQNTTNDYYYNYTREIVTIGLSSYLYL